MVVWNKKIKKVTAITIFSNCWTFRLLDYGQRLIKLKSIRKLHLHNYHATQWQFFFVISVWSQPKLGFFNLILWSHVVMPPILPIFYLWKHFLSWKVTIGIGLFKTSQSILFWDDIKYFAKFYHMCCWKLTVHRGNVFSQKRKRL